MLNVRKTERSLRNDPRLVELRRFYACPEPLRRAGRMPVTRPGLAKLAPE